MSDAIESMSVVQHAERDNIVLMPVMNIELAKNRLAQFQEFVKGYLKEEEDYGTIPGTPKPTLYKPGADKLCELYGLADNYEILTQVEDFKADPPLFDYTIKCTLTSRRDDSLVASGLGSCNSYEGKYKYRELQRTCPSCGKQAIIRGKEEYGGGWLCWKKKDGCGMKFSGGDKSIEDQQAGKIFNDDIPTLKNTILKMAKKRAKVDATLAATRSSGIFTQDMEDIKDVDDTQGQGTRAQAQAIGQAVVAEKQSAIDTKAIGDPIEFWSTPGKELTKVVGSTNVARLRGLLNSNGSALYNMMVWLDADKCWSIPNSQVAELENLCISSGMKVNHKELIAPAAAPNKQVGSFPKIVSAKEFDKGFLSVKWGLLDCSCWDRALWPWIIKGVGAEADFIVEDNKKGTKVYHNIKSIRSIGGREFDHLLGTPVRTLDDGPEITDEDLPF
jgi:ribosomal protein L37AE/L43A